MIWNIPYSLLTMNSDDNATRYSELGTQFFRYAGVGGAASLLDWGLFGVCYGAFGMHYLQATIISLMAGALVGYLLSSHFVFQRGAFSRFAEILLVCSVSTVGLALNAGLMLVLVENLSFSPVTAKVAATFGVFCWNFLSRRHFVFADNPFRFLNFLYPERNESAFSREIPAPVRSESRSERHRR